MARLVVITTPDLAPGYRIGGATVAVATSGAEAETALSDLVRARDVAIVGIHADLFAGISDALKRDVERQILPVVIDIPSGAEGERQTRRERLVEMLRHAIGQRIAFRSDGGEG
jgi:vacuolar-type H+-ATPase subunit F/Vma7